ncbi:hypothetical protein MITS9509_02035 [Synechococcus sp. MIT S9509]|nr:hypothetical protein MITS9504_02833 [Synechococcus sp. MIT S9504]KZR91704.1 hypothetical protein MITS9509_02035 [Synechococcus sp. MIT S9509]
MSPFVTIIFLQRKLNYSDIILQFFLSELRLHLITPLTEDQWMPVVVFDEISKSLGD